MEVKWMSRDRNSEFVEFWTKQPDYYEGGGSFGGADSVASILAAMVPNAPEEDTCVPVESFKPIEVTVKKVRWLCRERENLFHLAEGGKPSPYHRGGWQTATDGHFIDTAFGAVVASYILPNHNLQPGQCIEIPPR